jgi:hypothetical protein
MTDQYTTAEPTRTDQLRDAIYRCETRKRIAARNIAQCNPANERLLYKLRNDYSRADDDVRWLHRRLEEALEAGSAAFRREAVE